MAYPNKMVIVSYEKPDFTSKAAQYTVLVNPEKYSQSFSIDYDTSGAPGSMNTAMKFTKMPPSELKFELLFDATGVIDGSPTDLAAEIATFRSVVYDYDGEIHEPRYLKLYWGKMSFGARLTSMTFNYTLFAPNGAPLRAKADVSFKNYEDPASIKKKEDKKSPDLTRRIVVKAGDTLPLISYKLYGDTSHYIGLAEVNRLVDFRNLRTGQTLIAPPLE
jgi:nucleoid-associated protein YgaU